MLVWRVRAKDSRERLTAYDRRTPHPNERNDKNYGSFTLELKDYLWECKENCLDKIMSLRRCKSSAHGATECWVATKFRLCFFLHIAQEKQPRNGLRARLRVVSHLADAADVVSPQERPRGWAKWQEDSILMVFGIPKGKQTPGKKKKRKKIQAQQAKCWMAS